MSAEPVITDRSEPDDGRMRVQMRIKRLIWHEMKIQAIREDCTAEQLAEKAFSRLLDMPA